METFGKHLLRVCWIIYNYSNLCIISYNWHNCTSNNMCFIFMLFANKNEYVDFKLWILSIYFILLVITLILFIDQCKFIKIWYDLQSIFFKWNLICCMIFLVHYLFVLCNFWEWLKLIIHRIAATIHYIYHCH